MAFNISGNTEIKFKDNFDWFVACGLSIKSALVVGAIVGILLFVIELIFSDGNLETAILTAIVATIIVPIIAVPLNLLLLLFNFSKLSPAQRLVQWNINEQHLGLSDESGNKIETPWSQVEKIRQKKNGLLIHQKPKCSRWIPNRLFSEDERAELVKFSTQRSE